MPASVGRHEVENLLQGPTGLAEQIAQDTRQRDRVEGKLPDLIADAMAAKLATELLGRLDQDDIVPELGQPSRRGKTCETAADHHHPSHARTLRRPPTGLSACTHLDWTQASMTGGPKFEEAWCRSLTKKPGFCISWSSRLLLRIPISRPPCVARSCWPRASGWRFCLRSDS